jgi:hypothetical protein
MDVAKNANKFGMFMLHTLPVVFCNQQKIDASRRQQQESKIV